MPYVGKRIRQLRKDIGLRTQIHSVKEAVSLIVKHTRKWESVDIAIRLGVNPRKPDQNVRGTTVLPHGTGKVPRVIAFIKDVDQAKAATDAGADVVGTEDLVEKIVKEGWVDFDIAIATPDTMKIVSKAAKVLGPRGLMPNPKSGTVGTNVAQMVQEFKAGKIEYRVDKSGIIHSTVGRSTFTEDALVENIQHIITTIVKARPSSVKGQYIKSLFLSGTQTPSLKLDHSVFLK